MRALLLSGLLASVAVAVAAPAIPPGTTKWEYAELGVRYGALPEDNTLNGHLFRWTTGKDEWEVKSWHELAAKLKIDAPPADASAARQRLHFLSKLGEQGWEMIDHPIEATGKAAGPSFIPRGTWTFKRRLP